MTGLILWKERNEEATAGRHAFLIHLKAMRWTTLSHHWRCPRPIGATIYAEGPPRQTAGPESLVDAVDIIPRPAARPALLFFDLILYTHLNPLKYGTFSVAGCELFEVGVAA